MTVTIRASSTPRILACNASLHAPGERINPDSPEARLGSAGHVIYETLPTTGQPDWDRIPGVAKEYRVGEEDLRILAAQAKKLWESPLPGWNGTMGEIFCEAITEHQMQVDLGEGVTLTGSPDLLFDHGDSIYVIDWKTGRVDRDYRAQLASYALLAADGGAFVTAHVIVAWVRDGETEQHLWTWNELQEHRKALVKAAQPYSWDGTYRPGDHCAYCPIEASCTARTAMVRADIGAMLDSDADSFGALEPAAQVELVEKARAVEKLCKRIVSAARAHVIEHGTVEGDGRSLVISEVERSSVDTGKAMPVLRYYVHATRLGECLTMKVSAAKKAVGEGANRGKKGETIKAFLADLEAHGALTKTITRKLEIKRTP
jgi:hypothetical protein